MVGRATRSRWLAGIAVILIVPGLAVAQRLTASEYEVKAAFLYRFAEYVTWPANAFADPAAPVVIGVLGDDPFGSTLDEVIGSKRCCPDRKVVIRRLRHVDQAAKCHVLFISSSEASHLPDILSALNNANVLTVADMDQFVDHGGMIGLFRDTDNRLKFDINLEAARHAGLVLSSELLKVARRRIGVQDVGF